MNGGGDNLEVMILRDCMHLKEIEVERFMEAVLAGEFKHLKHLVHSKPNSFIFFVFV